MLSSICQQLALLLGFVFLAQPLFCQIDTLPFPTTTSDLLEDVQRTSGSDNGDFDFNAQFDILQSYRDRPLNLNRCTENDLKELGLLSDGQIQAFLLYRSEAGELISTLELQAVPEMDLNTIRKILPYVAVSGDLDDFQIGLREMARDGRNEVQMRWSRIIEKLQGFQPSDSGNSYLGDPNQLYLRFRHTYYNRMSYGITASKDRGEQFFKGNNKDGFDFYSAHFFLNHYRKNLKALAIGDFNASFGQGLVLYSGFSYGKSALATTIKRNNRTLRPYASANQSNYLRGIGVTYSVGKNWDITAFFSSVRKDGNLLGQQDTTNSDRQASFSAFVSSGLHRTSSEIADQNTVHLMTTGASLQYNRPTVHLGFNGLYQRLDKPLTPTLAPYNQFYFTGTQLVNLSVDYSFLYRNLNFFGETARSDNGAISTLNGLLLGLDRRTDLAILYRRYPRNYQSLNAAPFGEAAGGRNEEGLYLGLETRPIPNWSVAGYFDMWRFPWLRFQVDAPSRGHEYRLRLTFEKRRRMRAFVEFRQEFKEENQFANETPFNILAPTKLTQLRFFVTNQVTKALELRTRADWGFYTNNAGGFRKGFVVLQDFIFQPIAFPVSFNTRFALFHTDGYDVRFYYYENDLLNTFSIPPYYNIGSRIYFNIRYRPISKLTLEARFAQTFWSNQKQVGTGLDATPGQTRTQISTQIKYVF